MTVNSPLDLADSLEAWLLSNTAFAKHAGAPLDCWSQDGMVGLHLVSAPAAALEPAAARAMLGALGGGVARAATLLQPDPSTGLVAGRDLLGVVVSVILGADFEFRDDAGGGRLISNGRVLGQLDARHMGRNVNGLYAAAVRCRGLAAARCMLSETDRLGCGFCGGGDHDPDDDSR